MPQVHYNKAAAFFESCCSYRIAHRQVMGKLTASREDLRKINAQVKDAILVEELAKEQKKSAVHYNDHMHETMTRLQCRLWDLNVSSTV